MSDMIQSWWLGFRCELFCDGRDFRDQLVYAVGYDSGTPTAANSRSHCSIAIICLLLCDKMTALRLDFHLDVVCRVAAQLAVGQNQPIGKGQMRALPGSTMKLSFLVAACSTS